jgi:hypothetical protein
LKIYNLVEIIENPLIITGVVFENELAKAVFCQLTDQTLGIPTKQKIKNNTKQKN